MCVVRLSEYISFNAYLVLAEKPPKINTRPPLVLPVCVLDVFDVVVVDGDDGSDNIA